MSKRKIWDSWHWSWQWFHEYDTKSIGNKNKTRKVRLCLCSVTQLCLTLCDSMDCRLPGSCVHVIFQAKILDQMAISFSRGFLRPRDRIRISSFSCTVRQILYYCATWKPVTSGTTSILKASEQQRKQSTEWESNIQNEGKQIFANHILTIVNFQNI